MPFPTNRELEVRNGDIRPFDVLQNNLIVNSSEEGVTTIITEQGDSIIVYPADDGVHLNARTWDNVSLLNKYILIRRALKNIKG